MGGGGGRGCVGGVGGCPEINESKVKNEALSRGWGGNNSRGYKGDER